MIGIIDYGMGNLRSVENALRHIGAEALISDDPKVLETCGRLILPGVGAFGDCMDNMNKRNLAEPVKAWIAAGKPLLGICVGMQMLFEESEEKGIHQGLGILKGRIVRMKTDLPVPEIGWNRLEVSQNHPVFQELSDEPYVYYVHSYCADGYDPDDLIGYSMYGDVRVAGLLAKGNVLASQFHPEKSGEDGLRTLRWFAKESL